MSNAKDKKGNPSALIANNRRASHEYHILERFEAGLVLEGWEVKAIRAGKATLADAYVIFKDGEAFLLGVHITPLLQASTHVHPDPTRTRKLLLSRREIDRLMGQVQQKGLTCVPLNLHWCRGRAKADIALVKGKQLHDKREAEKTRDWQREKARVMRHERG